MPDNKTFILHTDYGDYNAMLKVGAYSANNNIAVAVMVEEEDCPGLWEPWSNLTVNINDLPNMGAKEVFAAIDTNNFPEGIALIEELGLGKATGIDMQSGFCNYPLYALNFEKLKEFDPVGCVIYENMVFDKDERDWC